MRRLFVGPNNCGKSEKAETLIETRNTSLGYFATLDRKNNAHADKIAKHRKRRGDKYRTIETAFAIYPDISALQSLFDDDCTILVDGLTVYTYKILESCKKNEMPHKFEAFAGALIRTLSRDRANWVLVDIAPDSLEKTPIGELVPYMDALHRRILTIKNAVLSEMQSASPLRKFQNEGNELWTK
ncbi:MAG: hypothetical protein GY854_14285 [Deltaproteobacteria bacterium]|nr:hypothetical protein [Deltaproteobacteria bacterium]